METVFDTQATEKVVTSMDKASRETQPFLASGDKEQPVIVGDVNNVDNEADYVVEFMYPKGYVVQGDFVETPQGLQVVRRFVNKKITPKLARRLRHAVSTLILYFSKVDTKTGLQELMTISDVANIYGTLSDEVVDAFELVVQKTLGISDLDMEYVTDSSLLQVATDIIENNSGFFQ